MDKCNGNQQQYLVNTLKLQTHMPQIKSGLSNKEYMSLNTAELLHKILNRINIVVQLPVYAHMRFNDTRGVCDFLMSLITS